MGAPPTEAGRRVGEDLHRIRIPRGFWLDATEVTNSAFQAFAPTHPGKSEHPVVWVSWDEARAYCQWAGKRLPTEAEWEYAARAGTTTAYWWGDRFDSTRANAGMRTRPVGNPAHRNPWGLYDMLGNVFEWTSTAIEPYPYRDADGREDAAFGGERVIRGGSWFVPPMQLRAAFRGYSGRDTTSDLVGFRCAA